MGYQQRHTIVVSGYESSVPEAHEAAVRIFSDDPENGWDGKMVSPIVSGIANGERAFFVAPDGSKEGWGTSNAGDARRDRFIDWLRRRSEEPGYERVFLVEWAEVVFGDDVDHAGVPRHNNDGVYATQPDW